jgi:hypothetical protein
MRLAHEKQEPRIHPALHIDVLVQGRRVSDETFTDRRRISVGRGRNNAVVLFDVHAPRSVPLFQRSRAGYDLRFTDDMHGWVARTSQGPLSELAQLHAAASTHGHVHDLPLGEGAHGQIELGDETLEFEVVAGVEPLVVPRRWTGGTALAAVLLVGGLLAWTLFRGPPEMPRATTTVATSPPVATPLPIAEPVAPPMIELPEMTILAHPPVAARGLVQRRGEIEPAGTLRVGAALPLPMVDQVGSGPREAESNVGASDYTADGVLRPEAVVRLLEQQAGAVRASYDHALRRRGTIEGDLVARILVNTDGSVGRVAIVKDTLSSAELSRRVAAFLHEWRAPGPTLAPAEYEVPFHFRASAARR